MNYRHAFHAGNFADVLKHLVLTRCLVHLATKPTPFRVIDTHAGIGVYNLGGPAAAKTGEWRDGIGRLLAATLPPELATLFSPLKDALEEARRFHGPQAYAGSPEIARHLTRPEDRLIFVEKHPMDAAALAETFAFDGRAKVMELDGYTALNACVPPKERRGLVLIDPPFEERDEFSRMVSALAKAHRKWATGMYLLWYPVKDSDETAEFFNALADSGISKIMRIEMRVRAEDPQGRLAGSGVIIVNPPWRLMGEMEAVLPWLDKLLAQGAGHGWNCDWIVGEIRPEMPE